MSAPGPPSISVVVVVHDRTQFIGEALASVRASRTATAPELVVVGPSAILESLPTGTDPTLRLVPSRFAGLGGKLADGVRATSGRVIAFLEDDDRFRPERLAAIQQRFDAEPGLGYLQNAVVPIDPSGRPHPGRYPHRAATDRWTARGPVVVPPRPSAVDLRRLRGLPAGFNNSSIAVRREVLVGVLADLESADLHVDLFLLYAALVSGLSLRFDPVPLTEFRIHPGSTSDPRGLAPGDLVERLREFLERTEPGRHSLLRFAVRSGVPAVARAAEGQVAIEQLIYRLRSSGATRAEYGAACIAAAARWETFEVRNRWEALPLGLFAAVAPGIARRTYATARSGRWSGEAVDLD